MPCAYAYDASGNLSTRTHGLTVEQQYTFDAESRLSRLREPTGFDINKSHAYDSTGERVRLRLYSVNYGYAITPSNEHFMDGLYEEKAYGCNLPSRRTNNYSAFGRVFAQRSTTSSASTVKYLLADHLGSTIGSIDSTGAVTTNKYYPYGAARGSLPPSTIAFTGQRWEGGVMEPYYYHARFYSAELGHFLSADSSVADGYNRYAYVGGNPVNRTDPTGHRWVHELEAARALVADQQFFEDAQLAMSGAVPDGYCDACEGLQSLKRAADIYNGNVDWQSAVDAASMGGADVGKQLESQLGLVGSDPQVCHTCDFVLANGVATVATFGLGALAGPAMVGAEAGAESGGITLFRAVTAGEMDDIAATGAFRLGANSLSGGKWFSVTSNQTAAFAKGFGLREGEAYWMTSGRFASGAVERAGGIKWISGEGNSVFVAEPDLVGVTPSIWNGFPLP